jgi:hypothetical protein
MDLIQSLMGNYLQGGNLMGMLGSLQGNPGLAQQGMENLQKDP